MSKTKLEFISYKRMYEKFSTTDLKLFLNFHSGLAKMDDPESDSGIRVAVLNHILAVRNDLDSHKIR